MRILLIEDDPEIVAVFETEFAAPAFDLDHATSRDAARDLLATASYDMAVCDLRIPSSPGALDEDVSHGRAVLTQLLSDHSGTPVIAFSAYGTVELMQDLLRKARQEDFLGEGVPHEMLAFFSKDQLPDCVGLLHSIAELIDGLNRIEIATGMSRVEEVVPDLVEVRWRSPA